MTDEDLRSLFREIRDEPLPPESLVRLRARLAERTGRRRFSLVRTAALLLSPVCLALLAMFLLRPAVRVRVAPVDVPPVIARQTEIPALAPSSSGNLRIRTPVRPKVLQPQLTNGAETPVMIRIETPDPDVVIVLVGD